MPCNIIIIIIKIMCTLLGGSIVIEVKLIKDYLYYLAMIKLALVLLIFNLHFIHTKPVYEISEKYSKDDPVLDNDHVISEVQSEVESAIENLVKDRARSIDSPAEPRLSLEGLNDIRNAVTSIDLEAVLVTNAICTTFIPKFPIAPLNSAIALVCYS